MAPTSDTGTTHIDGDGDLQVLVGPEKRNFLVCSKVLARASPVFKAMLFSGFRESKPTDGTPWIVTLLEDNFEAAEILFNVTHAQFDRLPSTNLDLRVFYGKLLFADKYDMKRHLPWISLCPLHSLRSKTLVITALRSRYSERLEMRNRSSMC